MKVLRRLAVALLIAVVALASCLPQQSNSPKTEPALQGLGLEGRLIFIFSTEVWQVDLASGQQKTLFVAPQGSWLSGLSASPSGDELLLAYAPPVEKGQVQFGNTDLYRLPSDGSAAPQPWLTRIAKNESFAHPTWSPDGQWVYYTHVVPSDAVVSGVVWQIERMPAAGGEPQILLKDAMWPKLSPDGEQLAYLSVVPNTSNNELMLANADGSSPLNLLPPRKFPAVDDHLFTPDGQTVIFSTLDESASSGGTTPQAVIPWTFGVQVVQAHDEPSDWFSVSAQGGEPHQLTNVQEVGLYGTLSPDGQKMAFVSQKGAYLMSLDGKELSRFIVGLMGSGVAWVK